MTFIFSVYSKAAIYAFKIWIQAIHVVSVKAENTLTSFHTFQILHRYKYIGRKLCREKW